MTLLRILALLVGFLAAGVAFMPLRAIFGVLPLPHETLSVGHVSGTIWRGRVGEVRWGEAELGSFDLQTRAEGLLGGRLNISFQSSGPLASGEVVATPFDVLLLNLNGRLELSQLAARAPKGATAVFKDAALDMAGPRCDRAGGRVAVEGLQDLGIGVLEGPITCEAGRIVLMLTPQQGGAGADILIDTAARGQAAISARSRDAVMEALIVSLGVRAEKQPAT